MTAYERRVNWYLEKGLERALAEEIVGAEMKAMGLLNNDKAEGK